MNTTDHAILPDITTTDWAYHTAFHANTPKGEVALLEVDRNFVSVYAKTGKSILVHRSHANEVRRILLFTRAILNGQSADQSPF